MDDPPSVITERRGAPVDTVADILVIEDDHTIAMGLVGPVQLMKPVD